MTFSTNRELRLRESQNDTQPSAPEPGDASDTPATTPSISNEESEATPADLPTNIAPIHSGLNDNKARSMPMSTTAQQWMPNPTQTHARSLHVNTGQEVNRSDLQKANKDLKSKLLAAHASLHQQVEARSDTTIPRETQQEGWCFAFDFKQPRPQVAVYIDPDKTASQDAIGEAIDQAYSEQAEREHMQRAIKMHEATIVRLQREVLIERFEREQMTDAAWVVFLMFIAAVIWAFA